MLLLFSLLHYVRGKRFQDIIFLSLESQEIILEFLKLSCPILVNFFLVLLCNPPSMMEVLLLTVSWPFLRSYCWSPHSLILLDDFEFWIVCYLYL